MTLIIVSICCLVIVYTIDSFCKSAKRAKEFEDKCKKEAKR